MLEGRSSEPEGGSPGSRWATHSCRGRGGVDRQGQSPRTGDTGNPEPPGETRSRWARRRSFLQRLPEGLPQRSEVLHPRLVPFSPGARRTCTGQGASRLSVACRGRWMETPGGDGDSVSCLASPSCHSSVILRGGRMESRPTRQWMEDPRNSSLVGAHGDQGKSSLCAASSSGRPGLFPAAWPLSSSCGLTPGPTPLPAVCWHPCSGRCELSQASRTAYPFRFQASPSQPDTWLLELLHGWGVHALWEAQPCSTML